MNGGPVLKSHAGHRYPQSAAAALRFLAWCGQAGVPVQEYIHRSDLVCGSTIGSMVASRIGCQVLDVGNPMLAMHSLREMAGSEDHAAMIKIKGVLFGA
ncbi:MAG: hypothetical protein HQL31_04315 [Planctomycetes bacterium]|nr:hypothetical protein [Planctomycetota bacterium]